MFLFQSTLPQGKWPVLVLLLISNQSFNPHFRKGSDQSVHEQGIHVHGFNPHFRKGSDQRNCPYAIHQWSFNPHFRKGSDLVGSGGFFRFFVSIHTSAREVTRFNKRFACNQFKFQSTLPQGKWRLQFIPCDKVLEVSIHTSAREVTKIAVGINQVFCFNPHFRKGSDTDSNVYDDLGIVSIHTSAREVTQ